MEVEQAGRGRSHESSTILSAVAASVEAPDVQNADGTTPETGGVGVGCSTEKQVACFALLNMTFASATNVANEREVVPDFDDDRLDLICG